MTQALGVGIAGYGYGGRLFHGRVIRAVLGLEVRACATRSAERAAQVRDDHPGADVVPSAHELLRRKDIDLVVLATPNLEHVPLALRALDEGKHVVVDKPLATSHQDAQFVADAADRSDLIVSVYHNRRWDGDFLTLRDVMESHRLGEAYEFESRFEYHDVPDPDSWRLDPRQLGDPLLDIGPHLVDQALVLFGEVVRVSCEAEARAGGPTADTVLVSLKHRNGVRSRLHISTINVSPRPRFRLRGTRGEYIKNGLDCQEEQLIAGLSPADSTWGIEPEGRWGAACFVNGQSERVQPLRGTYQTFYEQMRDAMRGAGSAPVPIDDAVDGLGVLEAARKSAAAGLPVDLETNNHPAKSSR